mmetsp:Transcript_18671/g.56184  ORF Transcript_18671/g.56184 Transcript_18671/m.56184 type:complete len:235 (+) Transcript_18671:1630-2334(+)
MSLRCSDVWRPVLRPLAWCFMTSVTLARVLQASWLWPSITMLSREMPRSTKCRAPSFSARSPSPCSLLLSSCVPAGSASTRGARQRCICMCFRITSRRSCGSVPAGQWLKTMHLTRAMSPLSRKLKMRRTRRAGSFAFSNLRTGLLAPTLRCKPISMACLLDAGRLNMRSYCSMEAFFTSVVSSSTFGYILRNFLCSSFEGRSGKSWSHTPMILPLLPTMSARWLRVIRGQSTA